MRYSIINSSEVIKNFDIRVDAEYFDPEHLSLENNILQKKWEYLEDISNVRGGKRLPLGETFSEEGIPYIRAEDVKNDFVEYKNSPKISNNLHSILKNYQTNYNDVLLTIVGNSIGDIGIVKFKLDKCNLTENCVKIINLKILPEYLFAFLLSKYGKSQINREKVGTAQPKLAIVRIRKFKTPITEVVFQKFIKIIIDKAYELKENSLKNYSNAENLLLSALEILNWQPKHELSYVKKFSDVNSANRYDAEYFQPKYDKIVEKIKLYPNGWDTFEHLVNTKNKNIIPKDNVKCKYIELSNISNNGEITGFTLDIGKNLPTRARRLVKTDDLIISSIEGSLDSITLITKEYDNSFCSNGFYVVNSNFYNSETLLCLLKTIIGQLQLKKGCSGTILTAISKEELNNIILPKIKQETQMQIKENIQNMYQLKFKSKQLLEIAKRGVEIAIEENEEVATNWINGQLSKIGVKL